MGRTFDVVVIGLGAMGTAACRAMARRGLRVLGLEQFQLCHANGSSHGRSRVIRKAYFEDPRYVPLLREAYRLWHELGAETSERIIHYAGCLNLGPADHAGICGARRSAEEHGLPHEVLDAAEVHRRWPVLHPAEQDVGVYETDAGFVVPEQCVRLMAERARRLGAELRENEPVRRWSASGVPIEVETDAGTYECRRLVITAGPWLSQAATSSGLKLPLRVERQVQLWFRPDRPERFSMPHLPAFIHFTGDRAYYGIPAHGDGLFKAARHHGGEPTDPDGVRREVSAADEADVRGYLRQHFPEADIPPAHAEVCLYTNTPDDNFILDRYPQCEGVFVAGGFSGHGFKFAPIVGEIMADFAQYGKTQQPASLFSLQRFS